MFETFLKNHIQVWQNWIRTHNMSISFIVNLGKRFKSPCCSLGILDDWVIVSCAGTSMWEWANGYSVAEDRGGFASWEGAVWPWSRSLHQPGLGAGCSWGAQSHQTPHSQEGSEALKKGQGSLMTAGMVELLSQFILLYLEYILYLHAVICFIYYAIRLYIQYITCLHEQHYLPVPASIPTAWKQPCRREQRCGRTRHCRCRYLDTFKPPCSVHYLAMHVPLTQIITFQIYLTVMQLSN